MARSNTPIACSDSPISSSSSPYRYSSSGSCGACRPLARWPGERTHLEAMGRRGRGRMSALHSGRLLDRQLLDERHQLLLVGKPASNRTLVDRLPHLHRARSLNRALVLVELQASIVPFEAAIREDASRLVLEVIDHLFVADIEHGPGRQHLAPMRHQFMIFPVVTAELAQLIAEALLAREQL